MRGFRAIDLVLQISDAPTVGTQRARVEFFAGIAKVN